MKTIRGTVVIDIETCKGCELCIEACAQKSLALSPKINGLGYRYVVLVQDNCTGCINCALVCPDTVIRVYRAPKKAKPEPLEPAVKQAMRTSKSAPAPAVVGRVDL
jgi:2-oxoglutarate ferredoxin oxidoreductase subunit delta